MIVIIILHCVNSIIILYYSVYYVLNKEIAFGNNINFITSNTRKVKLMSKKAFNAKKNIHTYSNA